MQAIGETVFEIPYLLFAIGVGLYLVIKSGSNPVLHQYKIFGYMAMVLGLGDSTHLTVCRKKSPTSKVGDEFRRIQKDKSPKIKSVKLQY